MKVELYPKTLIQVIVQELESDGHNLSLALNCICAALLDSGICMNMTFAATTVVVPKSGEPILNPNSDECDVAHTFITAVFDSVSKNLLAIWQSSQPQSVENIRKCLIVCRKESSRVFDTLLHATKNSMANK